MQVVNMPVAVDLSLDEINTLAKALLVAYGDFQGSGGSLGNPYRLLALRFGELRRRLAVDADPEG
jgi:hypothetical protein